MGRGKHNFCQNFDVSRAMAILAICLPAVLVNQQRARP